MTNSVQRLFVSHSSKDAEFGKKLVEDLRQALGSNDAVWYDKLGGSRGGGLLPGDSWWDTITKELTARQFFLLIASPDALASPWVREEIKLAWQQHVEQGKWIIPLMYRTCTLPVDLATLHFIDFRDERGAYSEAFHQLLDVLGLPIGMDAPDVDTFKRLGERVTLRPDGWVKPETIVQQSLPQLKKLFDEQKWNRVLEDANALIQDRSGAIPADVYRMLGLAYLHMDNLQRAEEALEAAFALLNDTRQKIALLFEYIAVFYENDQWDRMREYASKIVDMFHDDRPMFTTVLKIMSQIAQGEKLHYNFLDDEVHPQPVQYLTYSDHSGSIFSVDWSPNGKYLASASNDRTVQVWECIQPYGHHVIRYTHKQGVRGVAWSPVNAFSEEPYLATACSDGNVYLWQLFEETPMHTFRGHRRGVRSVAWSRDGSMLASGSSDGTVCLWDVREKRLVHTFRGHSDWVNAVSWSPDGSCIASASSDGTVKIWNINTRECRLTYNGHAGKAVNALIWSPNARTIGSAGDDQKVHLWESETGNLRFEYKSHNNPVTALARSRHGRRLASVSKGVRVWYAATGDAILTNLTSVDWVRTVAWSPDDTMIAVAGDDSKVRVWNIGYEL